MDSHTPVSYTHLDVYKRQVYVQAAIRLAAQIGKKVVYYPGGHNLPYDLPLEFAICVIGTLAIVKK